MQSETFPGSHLTRELKKLTDDPVPSWHGDLYFRVLDDKIPADFVNRRWLIKYADLPEIMSRLGLTPKQVPGAPAAAPQRQSAPASTSAA